MNANAIFSMTRTVSMNHKEKRFEFAQIAVELLK